MPILNKRQTKSEGDQSDWFIRTSGSDHPLTFQLQPEGYKWLLASQLGNKSNIGWDVFETLRSLNLLYIRGNSHSLTDAPIPDDLSLDQISVKERLNLVEGLLDRFAPSELSAQKGPLQFLLSFGDLDWTSQEPVLNIVLTGTPFSSSVIFNYKETFSRHGYHIDESIYDYNPILLALVVRVAYDTIEPMSDVERINEGHPIWVYDDWIVCAGSELIFYEVSNTITDALPEPLFDEILRAAGSRISDEMFYEFFDREFCWLSKSQYITQIKTQNLFVGDIITDGLESEYNDSILILPTSKTVPDGPFRTK